MESKLSDSLDHGEHFGPKPRFDLGGGDGGVFESVVEQGGDQGVVVHVDLLDDFGDGERVGDVRLPRLASLPLVGSVGDEVGFADSFEARFFSTRP